MPGDRGIHDGGLPRALALIRRGLAGGLPLAAILWALEAYRLVGIVPIRGQFIAAMLMLGLPLAFLQPRQGVNARPILLLAIDIGAAVLAAAAGAYVMVNADRIGLDIAYRPVDGIVAGTILLVLTLEALRRVSGWPLLTVVLAFIAYSVFGNLLPGSMQARDVALDRQVLYLVFDTNGLLGIVPGIVCTVVIAYVFLGTLLLQSGGGRFFTDLSLALLGRSRGGQAKVAVAASALFGSISGSAVANVASTGVITIPLMKQAGYTPEQAGAIEAVASTGGQVLPPIMGASAFIMADFVGVSYAEVVVAALIPSLLYYFALYIQVDLEAARRGLVPAGNSHGVSAWRLCRANWIIPIPFAVIVGGLFLFNLTPDTAAYYAAATLVAGAFAFGVGGRRLSVKGLVAAFPETGQAMVELLVIAASASFIIAILNLSGLGFSLTLMLVKLAAQSVVLLVLLAAAICIVLGMGMPTVAVYVLLAALVVPSMIDVGVSPMAGHMFVLYFGMMSMVTPPVAIAAFAAATIAGGRPMRTGFNAVRLSWTAYIVPFLFVASPTLLLEGGTIEVLAATASVVAGVWLVSVGVAGYLRRPLGGPLRLAWIAAGIALMVPSNAFSWALWTDLAGLAAGLLLAGLELRRPGRKRRPRGTAVSGRT